jgi:hypothetical protein
VAGITETMRRENQKIRYFEQCNPEWRRGTELPCVGVFDFKNLSQYVVRYLTKATSNGRKEALKTAQTNVTPIHDMQLKAANIMPIKRRA